MNRFWSKVDKSGDCWEWTASKNNDGYGQFRLDGKMRKAHRVALDLEGVDIPSGMCVCHTCDNRGCVNPDHLVVSDQAWNIKDMVKKGRASKGESHHNSKLCELDIWLIRNINQTHKKTADWFGISQQHVSSIRLGQFWGHVS